jgi:glycosyltransferase involved in cell wall biosynthesis
LTVALDATYSVGEHLSGVGVYCVELMREMAAQHPRERFLYCYRPHRLLRGLCAARPSNAGVRWLAEGRQWWRAGLFHGLNQRMPRGRFRRAVCTFHDLFVLTAEYSTEEFRRRFARQAREAAERADLIIAVSNFTAGMVHCHLGVEQNRIRVVPHGVRFPYLIAEPTREPVILHVGAIQKRKNLVRLVGAFERAAPPPWRLVLAGSAGFGAREVRSRIQASPARERIEMTGWIDDASLAHWYRRASLLAFPSLDEGFGIPVLEAMAQGLPVLASTRGALPEVCGDDAWMTDAESEESITDGLRRLVNDEDLRRELSRRGRIRVRSFSWGRAAAETWRVYEELR